MGGTISQSTYCCTQGNSQLQNLTDNQHINDQTNDSKILIEGNLEELRKLAINSHQKQKFSEQTLQMSLHHTLNKSNKNQAYIQSNLNLVKTVSLLSHGQQQFKQQNNKVVINNKSEVDIKNESPTFKAKNVVNNRYKESNSKVSLRSKHLNNYYRNSDYSNKKLLFWSKISQTPIILKIMRR
eukprot:403334085